MKRFVSVLVLALCLLSTARAEVSVPKKYHVKNEHPGYCMWCSLEVIGHQQGVKKLFGIKEKRKSDPGFWDVDQFGRWFWYANNGGHYLAVKKKLDELDVSYVIQTPGGVRDTSIIHDALKAGHPVAVAIQHGWHAVVLTHLDDKEVKYLDSNHPGAVFVQTREWFNEQWDGYVVEITDTAP